MATSLSPTASDPAAPVAERATAAVADLAAPTGPAAAHATPPRVALIRTRTGRNAVLGSLAAFTVLFGLVRAGDSDRVARVISRSRQHAGRPPDPLFRLVSWPGFPPESRLIPPSLV